MRHKGKTIISILLCAAAALLLAPAPAAASPLPPTTIPAIQQWATGSSSYSFTTTSRVVTSTGSLQTTAGLLAADLRVVTGYAVPVATGTPAAGDIVLTTGNFGGEGYRLTLASTATISGTTAGVFYGTQTLLQMLKQTLTLPQGIADDAPAYRDRGFMVDTGRKFYTIDWLRARIRELAYLKYNRMHLHLTDDQAYRIESSTHPEAVAAQHYTKAQIADLVAYAAQYQITIVPEIDMPGHMTQLLSGKPQLSLARSNGTLSLDLSKDEAWPFARDIISEYLPLFPGPYWHLGADEWLGTAEMSQFPQLQQKAQQLFGASATGRDLQYDFINKANDHVRASGKTMRIWNDQLVPGTVISVAATVQIAHWFGATDMTPQTLADRGHDLINANWNQLYYIIGISQPNPAAIYESFAANQFAYGTGSTTISASNPHLWGTQLSLWGEPGLDEPEESVAANLRNPLRSLAQNTWGSPKPTPTYSSYTTIISAVGDPPTGSIPPPPPPGGVTASASLGTYQNYAPANMADGNTSSFYWSDSAVTSGSWIQVDLGESKTITAVDLLMSKTDSPQDYIHQGVLEVSGNGASWTSLGSFSQAEIHTSVSATGRYVRYRATATQAEWLVTREFTITTGSPPPSGVTASASLGTYQNYVPENMADGNTSSFYWSDSAVTNGSWIQVDLGTSKTVTAVDLLMSKTDSPQDYIHQGVLEVSGNGASWTSLGSFSQAEIHTSVSATGRYMRYRATATQAEWLVTREFTVVAS